MAAALSFTFDLDCIHHQLLRRVSFAFLFIEFYASATTKTPVRRFYQIADPAKATVCSKGKKYPFSRPANIGVLCHPSVVQWPNYLGWNRVRVDIFIPFDWFDRNMIVLIGNRLTADWIQLWILIVRKCLLTLLLPFHFFEFYVEWVHDIRCYLMRGLDSI